MFYQVGRFAKGWQRNKFSTRNYWYIIRSINNTFAVFLNSIIHYLFTFLNHQQMAKNYIPLKKSAFSVFEINLLTFIVANTVAWGILAGAVTALQVLQTT